MTERDYPTTCAELKAMIDAQWPKVMDSTYAIERVFVDTLERIPDTDEPIERDTVCFVHGVVTSRGFKREGERADSSQIFFTEEEAIRALWIQYNELSPVNKLETGETGALLSWRIPPEVASQHGSYIARMRYSGLYRGRHGGWRGFWEMPAVSAKP